jgi:hypothetical protein
VVDLTGSDDEEGQPGAAPENRAGTTLGHQTEPIDLVTPESSVEAVRGVERGEQVESQAAPSSAATDMDTEPDAGRDGGQVIEYVNAHGYGVWALDPTKFNAKTQNEELSLALMCVDEMFNRS